MLLIEHCLSDLDCVLIKLHMDPSSTDSLLQKPPLELSAQMSVLTSHQQQLNWLTLLNEEWVKAVQALHLPSIEVSIPQPNLPLTTAPTTASLNDITVMFCFPPYHWSQQHWNSSKRPSISPGLIFAALAISFASVRVANGRWLCPQHWGTMNAWLCLSGWSVVFPLATTYHFKRTAMLPGLC